MAKSVRAPEYAKRIDWEKVQSFLRVAGNQGFSRAAREQGVSPSSMHRQIRALEKQLGLDLVSKSERPIRLTPTGELLYAASKRFDESLAAIVQQSKFPVAEQSADRIAFLARQVEALASELAAMVSQLRL